MGKLAFIDGVVNVFSELINRRSALSTNAIEADRMSYPEMRSAYRTGVGNKILRIKAGASLNNTLQFESKGDGEFYDDRLAKHVKRATRMMLGFGRGIITLHHPGDKLDEPITTVDPKRLVLQTFSGDLVSTGVVEYSLDSPRYYKPKFYQVRGANFHWTRVIDFTYVDPTELEAPQYRYGGISEFELIQTQLKQDGIIERASATIVEKASSFIYKIAGFKDSLRAKKDQSVIDYFSKIEDMRSIYGAVLMDAEDEATAVSQTFTNLAEINENSLRRLAMVTGIPLPWLVGENVKGMNSVGENERQIFQETIEALQSDYMLEPLQRLFYQLGLGDVSFKENQGDTPQARIGFETKAIDNALKLWQMGEDHTLYLEERGVITPDPVGDWFKVEQEAASNDSPPLSESELAALLGGENGTADPEA